MILTETNLTFPLSSVKPLDNISGYRKFCLDETKKVIEHNLIERTASPITGKKLRMIGEVEGLPYGLCAETGSIFLSKISDNASWKQLLILLAENRQKPGEFHKDSASSRKENIYVPKIEWIENTLRYHGTKNVAVLDVCSPPSKFSNLLKASSILNSVETVNEVDFLEGTLRIENKFDVVILRESLDRILDPEALLKASFMALKPGGLIFITSLVFSGFDMSVLSFQNQYLYPPDRANCFSLKGLETMVKNVGFHTKEVSTPGVLDVQIVQQHLAKFSILKLTDFEKSIVDAEESVREEFQSFLQKAGLSSFARIVGRKK